MRSEDLLHAVCFAETGRFGGPNSLDIQRLPHACERLLELFKSVGEAIDSAHRTRNRFHGRQQLVDIVYVADSVVPGHGSRVIGRG